MAILGGRRSAVADNLTRIILQPTVTSKLAESRRPLTTAEERLLRGKIRSLTARGRRAPRMWLALSGVIISLLWLWTLLASEAPWPIVTVFWLVIGGAIALWVRRDLRTDIEAMTRDLESALRQNAADVYDIHAHSFAQFEEIEDEGACYAFELDGDRLVFITGQEFYESARFPSLDFSLVYVLDERGRTVDMFIDKRGPKTPPSRTISATSKQALDIPEHLEMRSGTLDNLETILHP